MGECPGRALALLCGGDAGRAEQVYLHGGVEGGVEADGGGGVDDRRARRQHLAPGVVEAQAVQGDVPGHGGDPTGGLVGKAVAELAPQPLEAVVAQHVALDSVQGPAPAGPHH